MREAHQQRHPPTVSSAVLAGANRFYFPFFCHLRFNCSRVWRSNRRLSWPGFRRRTSTRQMQWLHGNTAPAPKPAKKKIDRNPRLLLWSTSLAAKRRRMVVKCSRSQGKEESGDSTAHMPTMYDERMIIHHGRHPHHCWKWLFSLHLRLQRTQKFLTHYVTGTFHLIGLVHSSFSVEGHAP